MDNLEVTAADKDTISMATVTKSRRKGLVLVTSTDKRGRLCRKEKGIESSVLIMGNGRACVGRSGAIKSIAKGAPIMYASMLTVV